MKKLFELKKYCLFTVFAFVCSSAFAAWNSAGIPDSAEIRKTVVESWLTAPLSELRLKKNLVKNNDIGIPFEVRMEEGNSEFVVIVAPEKKISLEVTSNGTVSTSEASVYPATVPGGWVLHRAKNNGKPVCIDWFFVEDSDVYLQFRTDGKKTFADLLVYGSYAARSVQLGVNFERLYTASFSDIKRWTEKSIPWNRVTINPSQYHLSSQTADIIRTKLPQMEYIEDACYDEKGRLCNISTARLYVAPEGAPEPDPEKLSLSGAGFVKYIVDGMVEPYTGTGTKIRILSEPTMSFDTLGRSGVISQVWNLTFTLDWVRNLAAQALNARSSRNYTFATGGVDVTVEPFAANLKDGLLVNSTGYIENSGYAVSSIKSLLYVLAATEPSWMYLAAVRQPLDATGDSYAFNNCAVIIPYFDSNGHFVCAVFEQNRELSLEAFVKEYSNDYVHLERVKCSDYFYPR